jgi:hypothetical protein
MGEEAGDAGLVTNCGIDAARFEPWAEALPVFTLDEVRHDLSVKDERWYWNSIATDAVARSCGRLGRRMGERAHRHSATEIAICHEVSRRCAEMLSGYPVCRSDEAMDRHSWFPFAAPSFLGDSVPAELSTAVLHEACGSVLYPGLFEGAMRMRLGLSEYAEPFEDESEAAAFNELCAYLETHTELQQPAYFRPLGERTPDNGAPVVPHFLVAMTRAGSVVGVAGLTVWT